MKCNLISSLGLHSLCYRRGEELKWFSPSVFIYLASVVPAIWFLELDAKRNEILCIYVEIVKNDNLEADMVTMLMDLMQVCTVVIRTNRIWKSTNRKTSCSSLDTHDPKMIDTSFESPKCRL